MKVYEGKDWSIVEHGGVLSLSVNSTGLLAISKSFYKLDVEHIKEFVAKHQNSTFMEFLEELRAFHHIVIDGFGWIYARDGKYVEIKQKHSIGDTIFIMGEEIDETTLDRLVMENKHRYYRTMVTMMKKKGYYATI